MNTKTIWKERKEDSRNKNIVYSKKKNLTEWEKGYIEALRDVRFMISLKIKDYACKK